MVICILDVAGSADTADQGALVMGALSAALASDHGQVVVSFEGLQTATSSFVNAAFLPLLTTHTLGVLKNRIKVVNSTRQINEMIKDRLERTALQKA